MGMNDFSLFHIINNATRHNNLDLFYLLIGKYLVWKVFSLNITRGDDRNDIINNRRLLSSMIESCSFLWIGHLK